MYYLCIVNDSEDREKQRVRYTLTRACKPANFRKMRTQISNLKSGTKNQFLNSTVDYTKLSKATSHVGHAGSSSVEVNKVWENIKAENQEFMNIELLGQKFELKANWSVSGKSVQYMCDISVDFLNIFGIAEAINKTPYLMVHDANTITVGNGKNSYTYICPSLITIL